MTPSLAKKFILGVKNTRIARISLANIDILKIKKIPKNISNGKCQHHLKMRKKNKSLQIGDKNHKDRRQQGKEDHVFLKNQPR